MWSLHPMAQLENPNIYKCKQKPGRGRVGCTMHLVFANKIINRGLCSRAFWSNPHTCSTSTLLTRAQIHGSHHPTRKNLFLSLNLLAHVDTCTAWHHDNPNSNHQGATRTPHLTLLSHICGSAGLNNQSAWLFVIWVRARVASRGWWETRHRKAETRNMFFDGALDVLMFYWFG